jgi:hypothetical protein
VQPYLEGARTLSPIGIVFSETTRFRYKGYDRKPYMDVCQKLAEPYLKRSLPLDFINVLDLATRDLSRHRLLVLPMTSGLTAEQLDALRAYVRDGGTLLAVGDALRHDPRGMSRKDFALADLMGVRFERIVPQAEGVAGPANGLPVAPARLKNVVIARPVGGEPLLHLRSDGQEWPLLCINHVGKGRAAYLATAGAPELTVQVIDWLAGPMPIAVSPADKQVILAQQPRQGRWVLHLLSDGDYTVSIGRQMAMPTRIVDRYPGGGWSAEVKLDPSGARIEVRGKAKNRLLVLQ